MLRFNVSGNLTSYQSANSMIEQYSTDGVLSTNMIYNLTDDNKIDK